MAPGAPPPACSSRPCSLLDLPDDLLAQIADHALDSDVVNFWRLSRVSRAAKSLVEAAAGRRRALGGDASSRCLRMRTSLAEPALPLRRLLSCMHGLEELDLSGAHAWVRDDGGVAVAAAIADAPFAANLRGLKLDHCERFGSAGAERLLVRALGDEGDLDSPRAPRLPRLRELSLRSCRGLDSLALLGTLPSLERLDCAWCPKADAACFAGAGPPALRQDGVYGGAHRGQRKGQPRPPPRLRYLDLSGVEGMHDSCVAGLPRALTELRLAATAVSDAGLSAIAERLPELRRLVLPRPAGNLWASGSWTEGGLAELRRRRPDLQVELASA
jgi:hypothetical protein